MQENVMQKTIGEDFLLSLQNAENVTALLTVLKNFITTFYSHKNLISQVGKLSDFESVVKYQSKLARLRIEYNARAAEDFQSRLVGLNNFGNDNYKYKDKVVRKLNLLINNRPSLDDTIYLTMNAYICNGWGSVDDFKEELKKQYTEEIVLSNDSLKTTEIQVDICNS